MTPKEKAEELFKTYLIYFPEFYNVREYDYDEEKAKQCALITVKEIIKALRKDLPEIGLGKGYWYSVKQEIEKL